MDIKIPDDVNGIIKTLNKSGFEAYIVGGCVRDSLMGRVPADWDVCTDATPQEVIKAFEKHKNCRIVETGIKHGTVTLIHDKNAYEITTYRTDGAYSDNRHPDNVNFVKSLKDDLARRDFTVNAIAYNHSGGLVDLFGGREDIHTHIIRTVGNAEERFTEDALRIMRALRFAAVLGFTIAPETAHAMHNKKSLLGGIAAERIASELNKMIIGKNITASFTQNIAVLGEIIPELMPMSGFRQNNRYHCHDVLTHTLTAVENAPKDVALRLTMLFHDVGKPSCYTEINSVGHFYGHPKISAEIAERVLRRLKYDNETIAAVNLLILYHDAEIKEERKTIKRWLNKIGETRLRQLLHVKRADTLAKAADCQAEKLEAINRLSLIMNEIIEQNECFTLKNLAVNGKDIIALGVNEGHEIGVVLEKLMNMVIDGKVPNDRDSLMKAVRQYREGHT